MRVSGIKNNIQTCFFLSVILCSASVAKTIYVDDNAIGANDGSSWENAYVYLQEALADANDSEKPVEIRVAHGIYKPNGGIVAIPEFEWRTLTFQLISGVSLKGGYAGITSPDPNARDIELYETILSGDLNSDDIDVNDPSKLAQEPTRSENSYYVVKGGGTNSTAIIDGFIISGGRNGIYNDSGDPTIMNCLLRANSANMGGGGMYNYKSSPTVTNCLFNCNYAKSGGGGLYNDNSNPIITNCIFIQNYAGSWFSGVGYGGGILNDFNSNPALQNCTFYDNSADRGNALACKSLLLSMESHPSFVRMINCIMWDGGNEIWNHDSSTIEVTYSNIQKGKNSIYDPHELIIWNEGNINTDPFFADPNNGDYHLKSQAGRWDPVSESWVIDNVTSPCIDAGDPNSPIGDEPEPNGGRINMGAYGGTEQASMSLSNE